MIKANRQSINIPQVDEFVEQMLDALSELQLLPLTLDAKPTTYDKYPRELVAYLEAAGVESDPQIQVEIAFNNWQTWLLRKADKAYKRKQGFPLLARLHQWMLEHAELFHPATLRHLKKSVFGRIYAYLYPRLTQIHEFADYTAESTAPPELRQSSAGAAEDADELEEHEAHLLRAVADEALIREYFAQGTFGTRRKITDNLGAEHVEPLQDQAIRFLLVHRHYFNRVFETRIERSNKGK